MNRKNRKKGMKRVGKKTREWDSIRKELKERFEKVGLTRCELCGSDWSLGFAHRKPRRYCDHDELYKTALLCQEHHQECDAKGHEIMFLTINTIIENRKVQP